MKENKATDKKWKSEKGLLDSIITYLLLHCLDREVLASLGFDIGGELLACFVCILLIGNIRR